MTWASIIDDAELSTLLTGSAEIARQLSMGYAEGGKALKWLSSTPERCGRRKVLRGAIAIFVAVLCSAYPTIGAVNLGDLTVRSTLGERFWAELPLVGRGFTVELEVSFGTEEDYLSHRLERKEVVDEIIPLVSIEQATRIYLYSLREVHEPSFDLIVKIHTPEGPVSRAYHIQLAEEAAAPPPPAVPREQGPPPAPSEEARYTRPAPRHPYVMHVASYREPALARSQVKDLRADGADAFMALTRVPDKGLFYRVLVGRYSTYQEATEKTSQLKWMARLPYHAPLELPYSVGINVSSEEAVVRRGYSLHLIPGCRLQDEGDAAVLLGAYATYEEAAAISAVLTKNGIPARVVTP